MKNGVPFKVAFGSDDYELDDADRLAWTVIFGEHEGGKFDWGRGRWEEHKP